jgi:hypothetical protein
MITIRRNLLHKPEKGAPDLGRPFFMSGKNSELHEEISSRD